MDTDTPRWFKSSHSDFNSNCLEAAIVEPARFGRAHRDSDNGRLGAAPASGVGVLVRDTRHRKSAVLRLGAREWSTLLRLLHTGERG